MRWQVYIIRASDGALYTGITTDIQRRLEEHRTGKGAKFFRGRSPEAVVYLESGHNRGSALRREASIKKLDRQAKLDLLEQAGNEMRGAIL